MTHHIDVPSRLQPPACSCGWSAPLPFRCTWDEFDRQAEAHMATLIDCAVHGVQERNGRGKCAGCASDHSRRSWLVRRQHYPKGRLPIHRTEAGWPRCSTCDGGGCPDCTDPA